MNAEKKGGMKHICIAAVISSLLVIGGAFLINALTSREAVGTIKAGFIYVGDASTAYTNNFIKAMNAIERKYGGKVEVIPKYNVPEGSEENAMRELIGEDCRVIFLTSYGYGESAKLFASEYPEIEFCQATCSNANEKPVLANYHTFMGEIYEGRYISGVAAGMKLRELIDSGRITADQAKIGYVAAYPYAEVISGYTSFFLGIRSVAPEAEMTVVYTNSWSSYALEKQAAKNLIEDGCVIISQHSDTTGPAVACENTDKSVTVFHVGYNQSMTDVAPTTSLTGCRINWEPYFVEAMGAVIDGKKIESRVRGNVHGNDIGAGFERGWIEMLPTNEITAAAGTTERINELIGQFSGGGHIVFKGDYTGVDPFDPTDTVDLSGGYEENRDSSAPTFHYVLNDVITVKSYN